jgi:hypothetical protein
MLKTPMIVLFVVLGVVFWFSAAMLVRLLGADVFTPGNPSLVVLFLASFPLTFAFVWIASAVSRIPLRQMFEPTVIMTFTAMLLDGVAITWFTQLYGEAHTHVMLGAALILWGGGLGMIWAWLLAKRPQAA